MMRSGKMVAFANKFRGKVIFTASTCADAFHRWREPRVDEFLSAFVPNSAALPRALREQTRNGVLPVLESLSRRQDLGLSTIPNGHRQAALDVEKFVVARGGNARIGEELGRLFDREGSDKTRDHGYESLYAQLLAENVDCGALVEIGIGTPNPAILSNMGPQARPGASLRAFRAFAGSSLVLIGADADPEAVRMARDANERSGLDIHYRAVDQLRPESLQELLTAVNPVNPYLVIDDGLHSPRANLNVLESWHRHCDAKWLAIEDVPLESLVVWRIAQNLLGPGYRLDILQARRDFLVLVERLKSPSQTARHAESATT